MIDRNWIHPMRWIRTRPFSRQFVQRYKALGGAPTQSVLQEMQGFVLKEYNRAIERVPREMRPERPTLIVGGEMSLAMHHAAFACNGRNIFYLTPMLVRLLELSDLGDMRLEDVQFPFDSFYVSFGDAFRHALPGPPNQIDGAYITRHPGGLLEVAVTSRRLDARPDRSAGWPFTRDAYYYADLHPEEGKTIEEILQATSDKEFRSLEERSVVPPDEERVMEYDEMPGVVAIHVGHETAREHAQYLAEGLSVFKRALALAMVSLCYLSSDDEDEVASEFPEGAPRDLVDKARGAHAKKQRQAKGRLVEDGWLEMRIIGAKLKVPEGIHVPSGSGGGWAMPPHVRRGHMRRKQRYGPGRTLTRAVWIKPLFINMEEGSVAPDTAARVYVMEPRESGREA